MPVSRDDFERGRAEPSSSQMVISYLSDHPDQAYTAAEISAAIKPMANEAARPPNSGGSKAKIGHAVRQAGTVLSQQGFHASLDIMVMQKKLQAKRIKAGGKTRTYYTIPREKKAKG